MNHSFAVIDGRPAVVARRTSTWAWRSTYTRTTAPAPSCGGDQGLRAMDFTAFWAAYEDLIRKARTNKLTADDFAGVTISLTNPAASAPCIPCAADVRLGTIIVSARWNTRPSSAA